MILLTDAVVYSFKKKITSSTTFNGRCIPCVKGAVVVVIV